MDESLRRVFSRRYKPLAPRIEYTDSPVFDYTHLHRKFQESASGMSHVMGCYPERGNPHQPRDNFHPAPRHIRLLRGSPRITAVRRDFLLPRLFAVPTTVNGHAIYM
ncbi:MAG: hypothetical protein JO189_11140 [Deltaproteobacteria bacterium]|nr:hypothetical protein [Deltaproteobacteria bacterium]